MLRNNADNYAGNNKSASPRPRPELVILLSLMDDTGTGSDFGEPFPEQ